MEQKLTNKVYITGGNIEYLPLIEVMIKSLQKYLNKANAIIYSFNCDYVIPGFECRRIDLPSINYKQGRELNLSKLDNSIFYGKYYATIDAFKDYEYVCWLDGDSFVLPEIERIWMYAEDAKAKPHPLFMHYLNKDMSIWKKYKGLKVEGSYGAELSSMFDIDRNPYRFLVASGLYLAHRNHKIFFEDVLNKWEIVKHSDCYVWADKHAFSEERLTNLQLWEMRAYVGLPITWVNEFSNTNHNMIDDVELKALMSKGFDVMYHEINMKPMMIHGPNPMIAKKTGEYLNSTFNEFTTKSNKLMIIAHPDDEMIFGGFDLLSEDGWTVICLTNYSNEKRKAEFINSLNKAGVAEWFIYDFKDDMYSELPYEEIKSLLKSHIEKRNWTKIVSHNSAGEYGHPHHHQINKIVMDITNGNKTWVFKKGDRIPDDILTKKMEILSNYEYAKDFIEQIRTHNGRWFIEEDMSTNYVEHGRSVIYTEQHNAEYIPCFHK